MIRSVMTRGLSSIAMLSKMELSLGATTTTAAVRSLSSFSTNNGQVTIPQKQNTHTLLRELPFKTLGRCFAHDTRTKGDEELLGFLQEEIATEKKLQRSSSIPTTLEGFSVKLDRSDILLTKTSGSEEVTISANVNHSVDSDFSEEQPGAAKPPGQHPEAGDEMRSRPNFEVQLKRGQEIISFSCSFIENSPEEEQSEEFNDVFSIDSVSIMNASEEEEENVYSVAGDILDGYLYDLFMNLLEERGVTNEFVDKFSDLCTDYEHQLYVQLLVKLQGFLSK